MKKWLKNIKWVDLRIVVICGIAFVLYSFANTRADNKPIDQVHVVFNEEQSHFVTSQEIQNDLEKNFLDTSFINRTMLDLGKIEQSVLDNQLIKDADVYITLDGKLIVEIVQKKAVARFINSDHSFYLDEDGLQMPLSGNFSKRVPMIGGDLKPQLLEPLKQMLTVITQDEFLKSDITGIVIKSDDNLLLYSRTNKFDIEFGTLDEIQKKLDNYKAFVQYSLQDDVSIDNYKKINLKFTQQVVCTK